MTIERGCGVKSNHPASLQRADEAVEQAASVGSSQQRVGGVLGMRHQPQDGAAVVEDAGDGAGRAVEVVGVGQTLVVPFAVPRAQRDPQGLRSMHQRQIAQGDEQQPGNDHNETAQARHQAMFY